MSNSIVSSLTAAFRMGDMRLKLVYINVGVFLLINLVLIIFTLSAKDSWIAEHGADLYLGSTSLGSKLIFRPWSVITYMFTHIGFWHLAMNMLLLWVFGGIFEGFIGQRRLLSTYLLGGLAGFVLYFIAFNVFPALNVNSTIVGASASIMAIVVALATYMPNYTLQLILIGPVRIKYIALFYVIYDFISLQTLDNTGGHLGHLGGAAYGFMYAWQLGKGKDIAAGFERLLDRFFNWFRPGGARFRVIRNESRTRTGSFKSDEDFNYERKQRQDRMDQILDKISKGGYDSLNKAEKEFLSKFGKD